MAVVVEQVTRNKKVLSSYKAVDDKVTIGRSYQNDVVLQDDHVCPFHAEIDISTPEHIQLNNCSDVNGIRDNRNRKLTQQTRVDSGDVFTIGKSLIRIVRLEHPVAPAKKLNVLEDISHFANRWHIALFSALLFFIALTYQTYATFVEEIIWSKVIAKSLLVTLGLLIIPALISLFTWFFKREFKFFSTVSLCFSIFFIWNLTTVFNNVLVFNFGHSGWLRFWQEGLQALLLVTFIWLSLYLASNMSQKKISIIASSLVIGFIALTYLSNQNDKVILTPQYAARVFPTELLINSPVTAKEYNGQMNGLFDLATLEAQRRNREADESQ